MRVSQGSFNPLRGWMRAAKDAPRGRCRVLERRHGLAEIVERSAGVLAAAPVVMLASFVAVSRVASNTSRGVVGQWGGAGGAICEDHFALAGNVRVAAATNEKTWS